MERMGFWGTGMAFKDCEAFMESMKKRGIGFLEMLAMEMKSEGKYVSRGLSFSGTEFVDMKIPLTLPQITVYDAAVRVSPHPPRTADTQRTHRWDEKAAPALK